MQEVLNRMISNVEQKWLTQLYHNVKSEFSQTWLPSHDHTHHFRVWQYAKNLIEALSQNGFFFSEMKLEQLILAVFFHDIGLTRTLDSSHGHESRESCRSFIEHHTSLTGVTVNQILDAVENHDNKNYSVDPLHKLHQPETIRSLLAVSDDLDAYGAIGVFRFFEIYFLRGFSIQSLAANITGNIESRFNYFLRNYGDLHEFATEHEKRSQFTMQFYRDLHQQLDSNYNIQSDTGPLGVLNLYLQKVLHEKIHFTELHLNANNLVKDEYGRKYFKAISRELLHYTPKLP